MAEREGEGEERKFKVVDRRRFTPEGEAREGVDVAPPEPKAAPPPPPAAQAASPAAQAAAAPSSQAGAAGQPGDGHGADEGEDTGGLTFAIFVQSLAQQAMMQLGLIPMPHTGQRELQLEAAHDTIDVLALLKNKTKGNLTPDEAQLLEGVLYELRMTFVQINQQLAAHARGAGGPGAGPKL